VAILVDPTMDPAPRRAAEVAARSLGLSFQVVEARGSGDLEGAFREAVKGGSRALMIIQSPMLAAHPRTIADLAAKHRLPSTSIFSFFTEAGLLMSYGPNLSALFREAARVSRRQCDTSMRWSFAGCPLEESWRVRVGRRA
jgi:putative tryptophan/tyrosine transport system substrate-binding protein